jgi:hypothetical protein
MICHVCDITFIALQRDFSKAIVTNSDDSRLGQQTAFSPTFCSMVLMGEDGKLKWSKLKYSDGDFGNSMQDGEQPTSSLSTYRRDVKACE